jgi:hypothetical protein
MRHIDLALGLRFVGTPDDGLEPFLVDPVMVDLYARAGMAFPIHDRIAIAGLVEGSVSGSEARARDTYTSLNIGRLALGVEGRYHFHHRLYAYGRVAPGSEFAGAEFGTQEGAGVNMVDGGSLFRQSTVFQIDGSLGLALRFAGSSDGTKKGVRFWGFAEGGYRHAGKHKFVLEAENGPPRVQPIELEPLSTSGGFFSTGLLLTF